MSSQELSTVVVAAAVVRDGLLLAARRSYPAALAGKWEFPGGKIERGEQPVAALQRELAEELGVTVELGTEIHHPETRGAWLINDRLQLRLWWARLAADQSPEPLGSHDQLRWCQPAELDELDWLPADRPMIDRIRAEWPDTPPDRHI